MASTSSSFKPESSWEHPSARSQQFDFNGHPRLQDNVPYAPFCGPPAAPSLAANVGFVGPNSFGYRQPAFVPPAATFTNSGHSEQFMGPQLVIHDIPPKTRVETQIPITMTLVPMPPGITRLHLPTRTMAKPKLIAKPPPLKSSDMLELDVMPVCASAMKRPGVQHRAFAIARGEDIAAHIRQQIQPTSPTGSETLQDADGRIEPMEGGPISICDGCMMRERKRANRRMEKEPSDEDIRWRQGEKERIVVFNETEMVDWKSYGSADLNEPASKRARGAKGKKKGEAGEDIAITNPPPDPPVPYPDLARQIRLLMRITCYCRHQGEPEGFQ